MPDEPTPTSSITPTKAAAATGAVLSLGAALVGSAPASAGPPAAIEVTSHLDDNSGGTLREAIDDANTNPGPDSIIFQAGLPTIDVTNGEIEIDDDLTITGPATINAGHLSRIFYIHEADTVTLSGLTLQDGEASRGGAVLAFVDDFTLEQSSITGSNATDGSGGGLAVRYADTITIADSTFSGNYSSDDGGGAYFAGGEGAIDEASISGSTFHDNEASDEGGGLGTNDVYDVTIDTTTLSSNVAGDVGGGAYFNGGENSTVAITTSTISGNTADGGGGVWFDYTEGILIAHTTIVGNTANYYGGAIFLYGTGPGALDHVLMGNNTAQTYDEVAVGTDDSNDPSEALATSFSLIESGSTPDIIDDVEGNIFGEDPGVAALANNGGPNQTHALTASSLALDGGDAGFTPPPDSDQRGLPREQGDAIDIGAYETQVEDTPPPEPPAALPADEEPDFTG